MRQPLINYVLLIIYRFLRERDNIIQWLSLYALAELFDQSKIGTDHLIRHSLLTVVISLASSDFVEIQRCVARILRCIIIQCGYRAIRHLIQSMAAPIDFLTSSADPEIASVAAHARALLIEAGP